MVLLKPPTQSLESFVYLFFEHFILHLSHAMLFLELSITFLILLVRGVQRQPIQVTAKAKGQIVSYIMQITIFMIVR